MLSRFFIERPIFAWVIAIVVMLAGALSILTLPVAQYPSIAPPSVSISASYPGADAETVESSVTQVIEQQLKGLDHLLYFSSQSQSDGTVDIDATFAAGTNPDIAQVQVQNKVQQAVPLLPTEVQLQGIVVAKQTASFLLVIAVYDDTGRYTLADIGDFVNSKLQDPISRVTGVGDLQVFGGQYAMRIWLDPYKLNNYKMTVGDVRNAVAAQNIQVSAGQIGAQPATQGQQLNATVTVQSRLHTADQFRAIVLRTSPDGAVVRLSDVARVELGADDYSVVAHYNTFPSSGIAVRLAPGANALRTVAAVKAKVAELEPTFPEGMKASFPVDTTTFVKLSIQDVIQTLITAILLVVGLLVDDAIVVVENVERIMAEEGLSPKAATIKSMGEITGALIGIGVVLSAVLLPMAFFPGSTGVIYRQFSVTIVSAVVLSVTVALVLTPALCATILKPKDPEHVRAERGFFGWFNRNFARMVDRYEATLGRILKRSLPAMLLYGVMLIGLAFLFLRLPTGFLPDEDQGSMLVQFTLPTGAVQSRTAEVVKQVEHHLFVDEKANVAGAFVINGFNFGGSGQNLGMAFVRLRDWKDRSGVQNRAPAVAQRAMRVFSRIRDAQVFAFIPPSVQELGNATGFDFELEDQGSIGHAGLVAARNQLLGLAQHDPMLVGVRPNGQDDTPQLHVDVDIARAGALGLALGDIDDTLSTAWGSSYIDQFIDRGRVKQVFMEGDAPYRMTPEDLGKWYVRSSTGTMAPFSAFADTRWTFGPARLEHYNGQASMEIQGQAAPGYSSGAAMEEMARLASQLPKGIGFEWTGLSYQEQLSGAQAPALYVLSLLVVFLCLAALYESWSIPVAVMLVIPLGVTGAVLAATLRGLYNDIYFQVGLLTTIGISAKNAILIVEFAVTAEKHGVAPFDAAMQAARLRLRPILMTSLAFIVGVFPLAIATGAGAGSQNDIGTGVVGGMLAATILAIFFVPVFFVLVRGGLKGLRPAPAAPAAEPDASAEASP